MSSDKHLSYSRMQLNRRFWTYTIARWCPNDDNVRIQIVGRPSWRANLEADRSGCLQDQRQSGELCFRGDRSINTSPHTARATSGCSSGIWSLLNRAERLPDTLSSPLSNARQVGAHSDTRRFALCCNVSYYARVRMWPNTLFGSITK